MDTTNRLVRLRAWAAEGESAKEIWELMGGHEVMRVVVHNNLPCIPFTEGLTIACETLRAGPGRTQNLQGLQGNSTTLLLDLLVPSARNKPVGR